MTYKWDEASAGQYAAELIARLADENYADTDVLDGPHILNLLPVKQVNLLILKELYHQWHTETARLQSPFFDFNHPEVIYALQEFKNILSQFIALKRPDFEHLGKMAVVQTLQLYTEPALFFEQFFQKIGSGKITTDWLHDNRRFLQHHKYLLEELAYRLESNNTYMYPTEAMVWVKDILNRHLDVPAANELDALHEYHPMPPSLTGQLPDAEPVLPEPTPDTGQRTVVAKSFFDQLIEERLSPRIQQAIETHREAARTEATEVSSPENQGIAQEGLPAAKEVPAVEATPLQPSGFTPPALVPEDKEAEQPLRRLNEQFEVKPSSLNDRTAYTEGNTHERIGKIESLQKGISINQRFLFTKTLFNNNADAMNQALIELDSLQNYKEAREIALRIYAPRYIWDVASSEVNEFMEMVKRRFSHNPG